MAEQSKDVQGLKTMLKGKGAGGSVKDQVKAALLKNKPQAQGGTSAGANPIAQQIARAQAQKSSQPTSSSMGNANAATGPMLTKIEKTVDSINDVHSTMESLNKNMNIFVDLFNKRGGSLASGGDSGSVLPAGEAAGSSTSPGGMSGGLAGSVGGKGMPAGQDAVTTLLLTNLLKKSDKEDEEKLSNFEKGSKEYLDLLIKKLDKFQHEYELLQYLFEPKMFGGSLEPSQDAEGNSAWLAGFMSMMMNKK